MKVTIRTKKLSNDNQSIYLDIYDNGKRRYEYLGLYLVPEKDDHAKRINTNAMAKAQEMRSKYVLGKYQHKETCTKSMTLMDWYDEYTRHMTEDRDVSKSVIDQIHLLRKVLEGFLKKQRMKRITLTDFGRKEVLAFLMYMRNWKAEKRKHLSQGTMVTYQQRLIAVFNAAVSEGYLECNPFNRIEKKERIGKYIADKQALTIDEVEKLTSVMPCKPEDAEVQRAFLFACLTGLRLSDIIDLKWTDIKEIDGRSIIIREQIKTGVLVNVPICETAKQYLPQKREVTHVFHLPGRTGLRLGLLRLVAAAGIEKAVTFHTSRHTFASLTFAATSDIATTSRLLGHTSVINTEVYAEVPMDARLDAINKMSGLFD